MDSPAAVAPRRSQSPREILPLNVNRCIDGARADFRKAVQSCTEKTGTFSVVIGPQGPDLADCPLGGRPSSVRADFAEPGCAHSTRLRMLYRLISHQPEFKGIDIWFGFNEAHNVQNGDKQEPVVWMMTVTFKVPEQKRTPHGRRFKR